MIFEKSIFRNLSRNRNIKNKPHKFDLRFYEWHGSAVYGLFKEKNLHAYFRSCTVWQENCNPEILYFQFVFAINSKEKLFMVSTLLLP